MRNLSIKTRQGRRYKLGPTVLYPIAETDDGLSGPDYPVTLVNENYRYPNTPTDTTYIFWDAPADLGYSWFGFFGGLQNGPATIDRIDVCVRGYGGALNKELQPYLRIGGKLYTLTKLSTSSDRWTVHTILGNWSLDDFTLPASAANFTTFIPGAYIQIIMTGSSIGSKDGFVYNIQIHLYGH